MLDEKSDEKRLKRATVATVATVRECCTKCYQSNALQRAGCVRTGAHLHRRDAWKRNQCWGLWFDWCSQCTGTRASMHSRRPVAIERGIDREG